MAIPFASQDYAKDAKLTHGGESVAQIMDAARDILVSAASGASPLSVQSTSLESRLDSILTELGQKLEAGGEVALSAATLAALESVTVTSVADDITVTARNAAGDITGYTINGQDRVRTYDGDGLLATDEAV